MPQIYPDATALVGRTPLVRLDRLASGLDATVLAKLEFYSPAASVKDRIGVAIVDAAERSGALRPGGTIVEATSGNTGISLAWVGAARGYHVVIVMPDTMSKERRGLVRAYGAELVLVPGSEGMAGAVARAHQIVAERPGAVLADQFANEANPRIHRETTGAEIWEDTGGEVDVLVAGIGTGGTVSGAGAFLKEHDPSIHVVGVEPAESPLLTHGRSGPHRVQGLGANFVPDVLDRSVIDEVVDVPGDEAIATARETARREGLLVGISSGAAIYAALVQASLPYNAGRTIVVVVPDFGERYLSTPLFSGMLD